jgi:hypothetical protein
MRKVYSSFDKRQHILSPDTRNFRTRSIRLNEQQHQSADTLILWN